MMLSDLAPKWVTPGDWCGPAFYTGVSFDCPTCKPCVTCGRGAHRLAFQFHPPIDTGSLAAQYGDAWLAPFMVGHQRTSGTAGDDNFATLTLVPSVQIEGHWHGHVTNGEITNA